MADVNVNFELEPDVTFLADLTVETSTPTVHGELSGRDFPSQHPISAITGLEQELSDLSSETQEGKTAYDTIQTYGNVVTHNINEFATASQGELSLTALQPNDNISELTNNVGFITNAALDGYATENFVTSQGYITGITSNDVTTALGYTPYNSSNPAGYTSNIGTVTSVNNTQPVNGNVTLNIPTATSDLTNDSGFITSSALTGYATETYVDTGLNTKQNTLVSGTNIKTINNETVLGSGNIDIQSSTVAYGTSSTAGNVAEKEVSIPEITELKVGQILYIKPSVSATVANLTIKLNNFTAYPIRYNNSAITTTTDDLVWNQNVVSQFLFDGTYWQFAGRGYDKDTTYTQNILFDRGSFVSGSGTYAITRYSLCLQKPDMTWEKITNTEDDYSLATDKTVNTHGFLLNGEMLYYSNATVLANGAVSAANTMYRQNSGFDIRYSMNTTGTGYTAGDYIYLVGTIGVDGLFYLDSTQWWTNTLPSTNDGKVYVKIGKYVSGVTITLELEHPAYYHDGTKIRVYQSAGNKQDTLVSGTNIKTINNQSLLGSGNITIGGGGGGAVDSVNGYTGVVVLTTNDLANDSGYITNSAISNMQTTTNLVTSVSSSSTDSQYPSALCLYTLLGDVEGLINAL